jgi:hypothetical protein
VIHSLYYLQWVVLKCHALHNSKEFSVNILICLCRLIKLIYRVMHCRYLCCVPVSVDVFVVLRQLLANMYSLAVNRNCCSVSDKRSFHM